MKVTHYERIEAAPVEMDGWLDAKCAVRSGLDHHAPSFTMRQFEISPGGHTPKHAHGYEHEVFILEAPAWCSKANGSTP